MESMSEDTHPNRFRLQEYTGASCICGFLLTVLDPQRHSHFDPELLAEHQGRGVCLNSSCLDSPLHAKNETMRLERRLAEKKMVCESCKMLFVTITPDQHKMLPAKIVRTHIGKKVCINPACASSPLNEPRSGEDE